MNKCYSVILVLQLVLSCAFVSGGKIESPNLSRLENREVNQVENTREISVRKNGSRNMDIDLKRILDMKNYATDLRTIMADKLDAMGHREQETSTKTDVSSKNLSGSESTGTEKSISSLFIINSSKIDSSNGSARKFDSLIIESLRSRSLEKYSNDDDISSDSRRNKKRQINHEQLSNAKNKGVNLQKNLKTDQMSRELMTQETKKNNETTNESDYLNDEREKASKPVNENSSGKGMDIKNRILQSTEGDEQSVDKNASTEEQTIPWLQEEIQDVEEGLETKIDESKHFDCNKNANTKLLFECQESNDDEGLNIEQNPLREHNHSLSENEIQAVGNELGNGEAKIDETHQNHQNILQKSDDATIPEIEDKEDAVNNESSDETKNREEDSTKKTDELKSNEMTNDIEIIELLIDFLENLRKLKAESSQRLEKQEEEKAKEENYENDSLESIPLELSDESIKENEHDDSSNDSISTDETKDDYVTKGERDTGIAVRFRSHDTSNLTDKKDYKNSAKKIFVKSKKFPKRPIKTDIDMNKKMVKDAIIEKNKFNGSGLMNISETNNYESNSRKSFALSDNPSAINFTEQNERETKEKKNLIDILLESINEIIGTNRNERNSVTLEETSEE